MARKSFENKMRGYAYRLFGRSEGRFEKARDSFGDSFVVIGFPRNGTSLVSLLVQACSVHFGDPKDMKPTDARNEKGFVEIEEMFDLNRDFLREAGHDSTNDLYDSGLDLRAVGRVNKAKRARTRVKMMDMLMQLAEGQKRFGFKSTPLFFYAWNAYLPKTKIVAVYRHPLVGAHSMLSAWPLGIATITRIVEFWTDSYKNMFYHLATHDSLLISYDDLLDPARQDALLQKLVAFVGAGSVDTLKQVLEPRLNRSSAVLEKLSALYPLSPETEAVFARLEAAKA